MGQFIKKKIVELVISVIAIICICFIPFIVVVRDTTIVKQMFYDMIKGLLHPQELIYYSISGDRAVFPSLFEKYMYSGQLLIMAFLIAITIAFLLVFVYCVSSEWIQKGIRGSLKVVESIPDLMLAIILQLVLMGILRNTGVKISNVYAFGDERVYFIPLVSLSVVPAIQMYKMMLVFMDEEYEKMYIELAVAKGLSKGTIIFRHMFRNMLIHILNHSKTVLLFMLSTLFVVEGVCNINGFMTFIVNGGILGPSHLIIWVLMLFLPFYLLFTLFEAYIGKLTGVFSHE